ncbi:MAG: hypothetical protein KatS3mg082_2772 [Nitrospiraceae bacterium]|nr:MAG: hypothetical protein KatS3mg082_2772 [Nitrospiraceae bacterium]
MLPDRRPSVSRANDMNIAWGNLNEKARKNFYPIISVEMKRGQFTSNLKKLDAAGKPVSPWGVTRLRGKYEHPHPPDQRQALSSARSPTGQPLQA